MSYSIRKILNWKSRTHLIAAISVVGLVAVACGSSESTPAVQPTIPTQAATATSETTQFAPTPTPIPDPTATPVPDVEPNVTEAPRSVSPLVAPQVIKINETDFVSDAEALGWKTDWSLRTVSLDELLISLRRDSIRPIDDPIYLTLDEAIEEYNPKEPFII
jgi:hypothetical protein